eukprot:364818-Chlamydomonas_euryale.AAC.7
MNPKMRAILVEWLVEVSEEYKLCADTLYQAVNYLDRFLSMYVAKRNQLQLVGVTCLWVASKYEEIYPPTLTDYCYITDNTYVKEQLISMEETLLNTLNYQLTVPTSKTFLRRLLQVCNPDEYLHFLSNYLTELSLLDYNMLKFVPSVIAAAGVFLANLMLGRPSWDANLRHFSAYVPTDIKKCVMALAAVHQAIGSSQSLVAIREKYSHERFLQVGLIPPLAVQPAMFGSADSCAAHDPSSCIPTGVFCFGRESQGGPKLGVPVIIAASTGRPSSIQGAVTKRAPAWTVSQHGSSHRIYTKDEQVMEMRLSGTQQAAAVLCRVVRKGRPAVQLDDCHALRALNTSIPDVGPLPLTLLHCKGWAQYCRDDHVQGASDVLPSCWVPAALPEMLGYRSQPSRGICVLGGEAAGHWAGHRGDVLTGRRRAGGGVAA